MPTLIRRATHVDGRRTATVIGGAAAVIALNLLLADRAPTSGY